MGVIASKSKCKEYIRFHNLFVKMKIVIGILILTGMVVGMDTGCNDSNEYALGCPVWANQGACTESPGFMKQNCKKSCNECPKEKEELARGVNLHFNPGLFNPGPFHLGHFYPQHGAFHHGKPSKKKKKPKSKKKKSKTLKCPNTFSDLGLISH